MEFESVLLTLKSGIPFFLSHFLLTIAILCLGILFYHLVTKHHEMDLIKEGNMAAAISFAGAWLGIALPLSFCMANSIGFYDIVVWGLVATIVQIVAFVILDKMLNNLSKRIERGEVASSIFVFSVKISIAMINAAAIS